MVNFWLITKQIEVCGKILSILGLVTGFLVFCSHVDIFDLFGTRRDILWSDTRMVPHINDSPREWFPQVKGSSFSKRHNFSQTQSSAQYSLPNNRLSVCLFFWWMWCTELKPSPQNNELTVKNGLNLAAHSNSLTSTCFDIYWNKSTVIALISHPGQVRSAASCHLNWLLA